MNHKGKIDIKYISKKKYVFSSPSEDFIHLQIIEIHDTAAGYFGSIMGVVPLDYDHVLDTICILNSF